MKHALVAAIAIAALAATAAAGPSVMVIPAVSTQVTPMDAQAQDAVTRGARKVTPSVASGSASLADAALMAGCEPSADACLDAVGDQLGVEQLVVVSPRMHGGQVMVDVTATRRGGKPARRTFAIGADPWPSLAEIEGAVPGLLGKPVTNGNPGDARAPDGKKPDPRAAAGSAHGHDTIRTSRPALVVAVGGAVLLSAGFTFWGLTSATQADIDLARTDTPSDLRHLEELEDKGHTYAALGNGLVIGGALAGAAGLTWLVVDRRKQRRALRVAPATGNGRVGLVVGGTW